MQRQPSLREEGIENNAASSRHLNELEAKITTSTLNLMVLDSRMIDVIRDGGCLPMFCPGIFFSGNRYRMLKSRFLKLSHASAKFILSNELE